MLDGNYDASSCKATLIVEINIIFEKRPDPMFKIVFLMLNFPALALTEMMNYRNSNSESQVSLEWLKLKVILLLRHKASLKFFYSGHEI